MTPRKSKQPVLPGVDLVQQEIFDVAEVLRKQLMDFTVILRAEFSKRWGWRWRVVVQGSRLICGYTLSRYDAWRIVGEPQTMDINEAVYRACWELIDLILLEVPLEESYLFPDL